MMRCSPMRRTASGCGLSRVIRGVCCCRATKATPTSNGFGGSNLGPTVPNARGNLKIQHAHAGRRGAPVQFRHGGEIGHHFSVRGTTAWRTGILRDYWPCLVGSGRNRQSRSVDERRRVMARRRAARADHVEVPDPVSRALGLGRRPGGACKPCHGRNGVCAADPRGANESARRPLLLHTTTTTQSRLGASPAAGR